MKLVLLAGLVSLSATAMAFDQNQSEVLMSIKTPMSAELAPTQVVLKNDSFNDNGGQAYIQQGFVDGEKVGIWVQVPANIQKFKVDSFRVLIGNARMTPMKEEVLNSEVFFTMGLARDYSPTMPADIQNAAQVTAGPYWNDIPAQGSQGSLACATGGQLIGAALEFTHSGLPSVYRDLDGLSDMKKNTLMAIPGGWKYSSNYGLRGDWVLRVVGHAAQADECP